MADIDKNPATLLAEQAALDPPQRRDVDVAAALRKMTETFAGVPDGRDTAHALPAAGQHGGPDWLRWAGGVFSVAALAAFALSRTVGLFGFTERGWQPSPHAAVSVIAEVLTVALVTASVLNSRSKTAAT
jgi:hypothetical protein